MLGGLGFANRVHPLVLGLPFLFAWLAGWVIATSLVMGCILLLDDRAQRRSSDVDRERQASAAAGTQANTR